MGVRKWFGSMALLCSVALVGVLGTTAADAAQSTATKGTGVSVLCSPSVGINAYGGPEMLITATRNLYLLSLGGLDNGGNGSGGIVYDSPLAKGGTVVGNDETENTMTIQVVLTYKLEDASGRQLVLNALLERTRTPSAIVWLLVIGCLPVLVR
jgi:hypothetical protein